MLKVLEKVRDYSKLPKTETYSDKHRTWESNKKEKRKLFRKSLGNKLYVHTSEALWEGEDTTEQKSHKSPATSKIDN